MENKYKQGGFSREDSNTEKRQAREGADTERRPRKWVAASDEKISSPFIKDKRPRIRQAEPADNRIANPSAARVPYPSAARQATGEQPERARRSYNPNFDRDNRAHRATPHGGHRHESTEEDRRFNSYRADRPEYDRKPKSRNQRGDKHSQDPFHTPKGGYNKEYKPRIYPAYAAAKIEGPLRLNKFISMSGVCSRREADELISEGRVMVNGLVVTGMGVKIDPADQVFCDGELLQGEKRVYILMNKPKGFVTTVEDPACDRTVMDIVKNACKERVYPVGRLDKNSVGVLLITNDGELTKKLTHPSYEKRKVYKVALDRVASVQDLQKLYDGIELEDGFVNADEIDFVDEKHREVGIMIHSGRNRIVRRMFDTLGYHIQKLDRVYFAGLTKKGLRRGAWRYLTPQEVAMLKSGKYE